MQKERRDKKGVEERGGTIGGGGGGGNVEEKKQRCRLITTICRLTNTCKNNDLKT